MEAPYQRLITGVRIRNVTAHASPGPDPPDCRAEGCSWAYRVVQQVSKNSVIRRAPISSEAAKGATNPGVIRLGLHVRQSTA